MLLGKRYSSIKVNKPSTCHNHQKSWTPQRLFYCKWLNQQISNSFNCRLHVHREHHLVVKFYIS